MKNMSEFERGWVVGIIEGEGGFYWGDNRASARVDMTDEDTVRRLLERTGLGVVWGPIHPPSAKAHWKPYWRWQVTRREEFLALAEAIGPHLSARRTERLNEVRDLLLQREAEVAERHGNRYSMKGA